MPLTPDLAALRATHGALLIDKPRGISSFAVIEALQRRLRQQGPIKRRELPKLGHGGTLDPFATGLLVVCVGNGAKLARYFLGSTKAYEGVMRFGETTVPGDPTAPISERSEVMPESLEQLRNRAAEMSREPYHQIPPMHSAKKKDGRPLYELARQGLEVERDAKTCQLHEFEIESYTPPHARFRLVCSSGTYVRTLTQDFARRLGTVGMLDSLHRSRSGDFSIESAWSLERVLGAAGDPPVSWQELPCWIPFDRMLDGFTHAEATAEEETDLTHGKQEALFSIMRRGLRSSVTGPSSPGETLDEAKDPEVLVVSRSGKLVAVARREPGHAGWGIERVFSAGVQGAQ